MQQETRGFSVRVSYRFI